MNFSELKIDYGSFEKLPERLKHNPEIADYYRDLYKEYNTSGLADSKYLNLADRITACCSAFEILHWEKQAVKSIENLNRCKDKFCVNCQSALAEKRFWKFSPYLKELSKDQK